MYQGAPGGIILRHGDLPKKKYGSDEKTLQFVKALYKNVRVLDAGARGVTTTFVQRGIGDVLLAWENEACLSIDEIGKGKIEVVVPSRSILVEPPVAIIDNVVIKHGTEKIAHDYLREIGIIYDYSI